MPNNTLTYSNPASMRPDAKFMTPGMQGFLFSQDRADYQDQVSLQDLMQQLGAQKTMALQPGAIQAEQAKSRATALTAVPEAQYRTEGLRLGNVATEKANRASDLKYKSDQLSHAQQQLDRAIEIGAVTRQGGPQAFAAFQQNLKASGVDPEIQNFFADVTDPADFQSRLNHLKGAREKTNIEWAKIAAELQKSRTAASTSQPNPWLEHVRIATRRIQRENPGMSRAEAEERASMEVRTLQSGEGGVRQPTPEAQGKAALAENIAKLKANMAMFPEGEYRTRVQKHINQLEKELNQPGKTAKAEHSMSQLRKLYPGKSDDEISKAYKNKFGVEPNK